jgi:two-component system, chemotaxis family, protein-glutamate methylesterase/glutaminase
MPRKKNLAVKVPVYARRRYDVVAMGSSAGGLNALTRVLRSLPKSFPSSIVVVQHLSPEHKSWMADLLGRSTKLHVKQAEHNEIMLPGSVYIAPPDLHLLVGPGKLQLAHTQLVHFSRPSIDLLFESVAGTYGSRSIGVVLSGSGSDGAAGIRAIKEAGGTTVAQKPDEAEFPPMPLAAVGTGCVDFVVPLEKIGETLMQQCAGKSEK